MEPGRSRTVRPLTGLSARTCSRGRAVPFHSGLRRALICEEAAQSWPRCRSTRTVRSPGRSELSATAGGHLDFATSVSHHALSLDRTRARAPNSGKSKIRSHPSPFSMLCMYSYLICFIPRSPFASCGERGVLVPVPSNQPGHPHDCSATFQAALRARREIIDRFVCMGWSMFIAA